MVMNIATPLDVYVRNHHLGVVYAAETGFLLATDPDTVWAADVTFVQRERVAAVGDTGGYWPGAPDLAIEVVSPTDLYADVEEKVIDWLDAGTRMVVIVNPRQRTVVVYRSRTTIVLLGGQDVLDGADVVPGWRIAVIDIFR